LLTVLKAEKSSVKMLTGLLLGEAVLLSKMAPYTSRSLEGRKIHMTEGPRGKKRLNSLFH
jgi:hypothetical protein